MALSTSTAVFVIFVVILSLRKTILKWLVSFGLYKKYYAALQSYWVELPSPTAKIREDLIAQLMEKLSKNGGDLLEIGAAVGRNMKYLDLPEGSSYIALDYNPEMESYMRENLKNFPDKNIPLKQFIAEDAANMKSVKDNSVTAVLATQLLCSLEEKQVKEVLKEAKRVLKPGGYYFFLEHVIDEPYTMRRIVETLSTWCGLPLLCCGCSSDRETWKDIEAAGFQKVTYTKCLEPKFFDWTHPVLSFLRYISRVKIHGYAVKFSY